MDAKIPFAVLLACLLAPGGSGSFARAADIRFGNVQPTGEVYRAKVTSLREARFTGIVPQATDFSCGAAALATLLKYAYDIDVNEWTVMAGMLAKADPGKVEKQGFSLLDIKQYVEGLGMRGRGYKVSEPRLRSLRVPGIVLLDTKGYKHFVVLKRIAGDRVYLADPALGNKTLAFNDFMAAWPSKAVFVVIGSGFNRNSVLLDAKGGPSARTLLGSRQGPITDAELIDFGFTKADLF
ncbi:C39 family peptidase [Metallibacterium scheffleri]|uniref:Peptidase n=1 Tax=Metallibacterium scheffleri TaxID=993689 RepID=A0A4S3KN31_9GAMM|nr:C39 family peptidase [Metallibacterium scheffleri]THD10342.1 peptidase [Metallibacterium scheffleri]